jgi:hypothetical protein
MRWRRGEAGNVPPPFRTIAGGGVSVQSINGQARLIRSVPLAAAYDPGSAYNPLEWGPYSGPSRPWPWQ